jgi:uncharacterized delta-60 repeat protein
MKRLVTLSAVLFTACGDDTNAAKVDAGHVEDAWLDAPADAPPYIAPAPFAIAISAAGPDQLMSAAPGPSGTFYAAGYAAATATGPKYLIVAKLTAAGALDTTFAAPDGFYISTLEFKGGSDEIDIAVQSDGNIVVAGTIANDIDADDRDIGLFRVSATGTLDTSFGTLGTSRVNLSTGYDDAGTPKFLDSQRGLAVGPSDTLFLHAASRNDVDLAGARQDTDFTVARLTANGLLDLTYGVASSGKHLLDLSETDGVATAKGLRVLDDGSVIAAGYAKTATSNGNAQPVLYRLVPGGATLDTSFATGGVFHEIVLTLQTEIYNFAIDNNKVTTAGYGRETGTANVWASLRFNATTGVRDDNFGGTTNGVVTVDPSASLAGTNCRNAIGLPGGKTALIGSSGGAGVRDAALAIITQGGQLDTGFGTGVHTFDLTGTEDQWWGGAISGGKLFVTGWRGVGSTQTDTANDNSFGLIVDL